MTWWFVLSWPSPLHVIWNPGALCMGSKVFDRGAQSRELTCQNPQWLWRFDFIRDSILQFRYDARLGKYPPLGSSPKIVIDAERYQDGRGKLPPLPHMCIQWSYIIIYCHYLSGSFAGFASSNQWPPIPVERGETVWQFCTHTHNLHPLEKPAWLCFRLPDWHKSSRIHPNYSTQCCVAAVLIGTSCELSTHLQAGKKQRPPDWRITPTMYACARTNKYTYFTNARLQWRRGQHNQ